MLGEGWEQSADGQLLYKEMVAQQNGLHTLVHTSSAFGLPRKFRGAHRLVDSPGSFWVEWIVSGRLSGGCRGWFSL
jgi:hypothetical protein